MRTSELHNRRPSRVGAFTLSLLASLALGACGDILNVDYPGRIPAGQVDDPTLAPVLVNSVIGDVECAYNNYLAATTAQSDEYETANSNVPAANWGERAITADTDDYVIGPCEGTFTSFGLHAPMQTARFQGEDIFKRLSAWTDTQVGSRQSLMATVRAYGGYPYVFFGETYCSIAFDGGPVVNRAASLAIAEQRFTEAISLAQAAGNTDMLTLARVGMARTEMNMKKWTEAAQFAALIPAGYEKFADRGTENDRRFNKLYENHTANGLYVIADAYRVLSKTDPRVLVAAVLKPNGDTAGAFNPFTKLVVTTKYHDLGSPIRLASYREAQLILAEAKAQQGDVPGAMAILNGRRAEVGLAALTASTQAEAVTNVIEERRKELSFEGGHRLNDLLRYTLPWKGANGSTQTFNPYSQRPYGSTTCWPLPTKETNGA